MTRQPAPHDPPVVLTIAGSDSGGGAGVQADLKTMEAHGAFGTSVLTAVTAQNTRGVESSYVLPTEEIEAQLDAVASDFDVRAAKTGMLATRPVIELATAFASDFDRPLVVDPVMVAASGDRLLAREAEDAYEALLAEATVATPNADEAGVLAGIVVDGVAAAVEAGHEIVGMGADYALVKGGHLGGDEVVDVLVSADEVRRFTHPWVDTDATHGSGCALASAIAARLAHGDGPVEAVQEAVDFMARAVRYPLDVGQGPGSVHHHVALRERSARHPTAEQVAGLVEAFVEADVSPLVPEVGTNVVGATPFAEWPGETAAVEGRIARTTSGVAPVGGVRFGASGHVARYLLAVREFEPDWRFACNCRFDEGVEAALDRLDWPAVELDRREQPDTVAAREGSTMQWAAREAFEEAETPPVAVYDRGAVGKEPMCRLTAQTAEELREYVLALDEAVRTEA